MIPECQNQAFVVPPSGGLRRQPFSLPDLSADSYLSFFDQTGKMLKGTVVRSFSIISETARGKLPAFQMIAQTFTAYTFAGTGFVSAVTGFEVLFLFTFHRFILLKFL